MRQMVKVQLQYCKNSKKDMVIEEPTTFDENSNNMYMNFLMHDVINKKQGKQSLSNLRMKSNITLQTLGGKSQEQLVNQHKVHVDKWDQEENPGGVSSLSIYKMSKASVNASIQTYLNKTASLNQTILRPSQ